MVVKISWFSRPGTASVLTPSVGRVHECRTSSAVTNSRTVDFIGIAIRLSTSSSRGAPFVRSCSLIMYESNDMFS